MVMEEFREKEGGKAIWVSDDTNGNPRGKELPTYSLDEIAEHDQPDDCWIIIQDNVYDLSKWVKFHPGGHLPLENMAGHDATDAFENYHPNYVYTKKLPNFLIGRVKSSTKPDSELMKDFRALRQRLLKEGKYETRASFYVWTGLWVASLFAAALYFTLTGETFNMRMLGAALLGCFWQQLAFLGHDLGHNAVTHVKRWDNFIGIVAGNVLGGVSLGWWKWSHNVHHIVTNSIDHDPDIQHLPIFAVTSAIFTEGKFYSSFHEKWMVLDKVGQFLVSKQHILYYPVMALARFNLYLQSFILLGSRERWQYKNLEWLGLIGFWVWFIALMRTLPTNGELVCYLLLSHAIAGVLHVQITLSHFSMPAYFGRPDYKNDESCWVRKQLATSMNVYSYWWNDWFHGGLQFQIEHHLFPRLPRHNLRYAMPLVKELCRKHNVHYHQPGFFRANWEIIQGLRAAAVQAAKFPVEGAFFQSMLWEGANARG